MCEVIHVPSVIILPDNFFQGLFGRAKSITNPIGVIGANTLKRTAMNAKARVLAISKAMMVRYELSKHGASLWSQSWSSSSSIS